MVERDRGPGGGRESAWNDVEAIVIAAQRPEMRFVGPKTEVQQARAIVFRSGERLLDQGF